MTGHATPLAKLLRRIAGLVPTREALERNRWLRPFARSVLRPDLWRFHRRSVPRGIALGFFLGVLVPFAHSFFAALLAVVFRANVPVAVGATWISNPFTWLVMWPLAYRLGKFLLGLDAMLGLHPLASAAPELVGRAAGGWASPWRASVGNGHHGGLRFARRGGAGLYNWLCRLQPVVAAERGAAAAGAFGQRAGPAACGCEGPGVMAGAALVRAGARAGA